MLKLVRDLIVFFALVLFIVLLSNYLGADSPL